LNEPQVIDLFDGFDMLPTQGEFCRSPVRHKFYIGSVGSGKTEILCRYAVQCCASIPDNQWVIGRYTLKDFKNTTQESLERIIPPEIVIRELPSNEGLIIRTHDPDKPSKLLYAHYDKPAPYMSLELGGFAIDEINGADQSPAVPEGVHKMLCTRLGRRKHVKRPYGIAGGNPAGHNWVWKVSSTSSDQRKHDFMMFKPQPFENDKNLIKDYYKNLMGFGDDWVKRYVYGSDDVFEGQVYTEFNPRDHIIDPFEIPKEWPRIIAMDHGLRNPTAVLLAAIGFDGEIYVYGEYYQADRAIPFHVHQIKFRTRGLDKAQSVTWVCDPSIFNKTMQKGGASYSVYDEYRDAGLGQWEPGENDMQAGRNRLKTYLKARMIKFFRNRTKNVQRELTQLHWKRLRTIQDRDDPEEEADIDNHTVDCLRYLVMSRPDKALKAPLNRNIDYPRMKKIQTRNHYARAAGELAKSDALENFEDESYL
jgi:hypothetical protein